MRHLRMCLLLAPGSVLGLLAPAPVAAQWFPNGVPICTAAGSQGSRGNLVIIADGSGGAIVAWEDHRSGDDIYAQRVYADGAVVAVSPPIDAPVDGTTLRLASANPSTDRVRFTLRLSKQSPIRADVVDAWGRSIRCLITSKLGEGVHYLEWDGHTSSGGRAPNGVYFLHLKAAGQVVTQSFTVLR